jgi:hypothetical protein
VSKLGFALSSLVAVVPAAFMMYVLIMGLISGMPMMLMVASGLAVVCGAGIALLPILGFIMGPKTEKAPKAAATSAPDDTVDDFEDFGEEAEEDEFEEVSTEDDFGGEELSGEDDWGDFDDDESKDD